MPARLVLLAALLLVLATPVRADVWGYVDDKGQPHFATEKLDDRYELFYRSAESFDTGRDAGNAPAPGYVEAPHMPYDVPTVPSKLIQFFEVSPTFKQVRQHLRDAATELNIDFELLQSLIAAESGFNATAVSPKGAIGLMQIMPATARRYGVDSDRTMALERKLFDPKINIRTGTRYLRDLINMFPGQLELAIAAYNAGEGAVMKAGNQIPNYKETQAYVKTVLQLYNILKPPPPPVQVRPNLSRVRPGPVIRGGAHNRGNLPPGATSPTRPPTDPEH